MSLKASLADCYFVTATYALTCNELCRRDMGGCEKKKVDTKVSSGTNVHVCKYVDKNNKIEGFF